MYTLNPLDKYLSGRVDVEPDQTIEILMTDLNHKVMELFTKNRVKNGHEATKVSIVCIYIFKNFSQSFTMYIINRFF